MPKISQSMDAIVHAKEGDVEYFKEAPLEILLNARDSKNDDDTVLSIVVNDNRLDCCEVICKRCPSLLYHQTRFGGTTPLHNASISGNLDILKVLISACDKADQEGDIAGKQKSLTLTTWNGSNAMHNAVLNHKLEAVKLLVEADPNNELLRAGDNQSNTPLHLAAENSDHEIARILINVDPDFPYGANSNGKTPLLIAIDKAERRNADTEMLKLIMELQPTQSTVSVNKNGRRALHYCVSKKYFDTIGYIIQSCPESSKVADKEGRNFFDIAFNLENVEMVQELYKRYPSLIYHQSKGGCTALHHAVWRGETEILKILIAAGAKSYNEYADDDNESGGGVKIPQKMLLTMVDEEGDTALHKAVLNHKFEVVKLLVEADPEYEYDANNSGDTPIMISIREARSNDNKFDSGEIRRLLFQMQPRQTMAHRGENGGTLLHPTASEGDLSCIEDIIKFCSEILDVVDNDGNVPLHKAVLNHQLRAVKLLVEADPDYEYLENKSGYTPIMISIREARSNDNKFDSGEIRRLLFQMQLRQTMAHRGKNGGTLLHPAASEGDLSCIEDIIKFCPGILDVVDNEGNAPLHKAVLNHQLRAVKLLVEADPDYEYLENKSRYTPIMISIREARSNDNKFDSGEIRRQLFQMQPRQTMAHRGENGGTLLHPAASEGDLSCIEDIIKFYPGILDVVDNDGNAPLHKAVLNHQLRAVKLLVEADPDYEYLENKSGYTPIIISIREARSNDNKFDSGEIRRLLFQMQPRQTMAHRGENGGTLLHPAASEGDLSCIEDIIKFCPEIFDVVDNDGNAPLHTAVLNHQLRAVKLLVEADPDYEYLENKSGYTPIIISIREARSNDNKFDSGEIRRLLFKMQPRQTMAHSGEKGWTSLLHQATSEKDLSIIEDIIKFCTGYLDVEDDNGKNFLHIAVELGKIEVVRLVLSAKYISKLTSCLEHLDNEGKNFLHIAAELGKIEVVRLVLRAKDIINLPSCLERLDNEGKNILHIAAEFEKVDIVKQVLRVKDIPEDGVLNKRDNDGNTPFHIAALTGNEPLTRRFLFDRRVDKKTVNNDKQHVLSEIKFPYDKRKAGVVGTAHTVDQSDLKDQSEFDLVVGALIATVSFTAGITVPGGYISDGPNQGTAVFSKKVSFATFIMSNTFALIFSLYAVFSHYCARRMLVEADIIYQLKVATYCTLAAIYCMMAAFIAGSFAVLANSNWLATFVCIISCFFFIFAFRPMWKIAKQRKRAASESQHKRST